MTSSQSKKILKGKTILVTRPRRQAGELALALRRRGARVVLAPSIRIAAPSSWSALDRSLKNLGDYDTLIFTSANGVRSFFDRARRAPGLGLGRSLRRPRKLYAIGPATARALEARGWKGVRVPESYEGGALARFLGDVRGWRILIPRARVARDVLPKMLARRGARVDAVEAYRTIPDAAGRRRIRQTVRGGKADMVTFTSSSTVEQFVEAAGLAAARRFFRSAIPASIGPITSSRLRRYGLRRILQAHRYTTAGLVDAIVEAARRGGMT